MVTPTPKQDEFLSQPHVAILSTVRRNSRPHSAPIWYLYNTGEFTISTGRGSQKRVNVETNPEISLVIDQRVMPYYALIIEANVEIGSTLTAERRLELAVRYLGEDLGKRYVEMTAVEDSVTLVFRPRKIIEYDPLGTRR